MAPDNRFMAVPIRVVGDRRMLDAGTSFALFATRIVASGGNVAVGGALARAQYAVSPDGRFLMNLAADDATSALITIVLNWTAGLA